MLDLSSFFFFFFLFSFVLVYVMDPVVKTFVEAPTESFLEECSRDELNKLADYYAVDVGDRRRKESVKSSLKAGLIQMGVLKAEVAGRGVTGVDVPSLQGAGSTAGFTFEQQRELVLLRMKLETEREMEMEKLRRDQLLAVEKMRQETEQAKIELQRHKLALISDGKVGAEVLLSDHPAFPNSSAKRDDLGDLRLVPKFEEGDPETFFVLFERVAQVREWSDSVCTLMLQCVLTGRAREAFSALGSGGELTYAAVKSAVLKSYELVPEAYRQRFRGCKRGNKSHLEFARDLYTHFDRWCAASDVQNFDEMRDLMILEQFKNSVPEAIAIYISENKVKTAAEAAALADDYMLTHGGESGHAGALNAGAHRGRASAGGPWPGRSVGNWGADHGKERVCEFDKVCHFCQRKGHIKRDCFAFKSRYKPGGAPASPKPAMCAAPVGEQLAGVSQGESKPGVSCTELISYLPFIREGSVSLFEGGKQVAVQILRDTGAYDSFIVASTLPFSDITDTGARIPVRGMGMEILCVPQHKMWLSCELFQGEVAVAVRPALPLEGIQLILGNDIAGGRVWSDQRGPAPAHDPAPERNGSNCGAPLPLVAPTPLIRSGSDEDGVPGVFAACAVTRAMAKDKQKEAGTGHDSCHDDDITNVDIPWSVSRSELVVEQQGDESLRSLWELVQPVGEVKNHAQCYFVQDKVLMRKWVPQCDDFVGEPVYQVVVPTKLRNIVLQISHDQSGHLGVRKTYDRILRYFFWPKLKRDVSSYVKLCHVCQVTGKPNQGISPAPLCPIPAIGQPFEHLIIDCVGPLPPSKTGAIYLLTVMCQNTRYPAAYPLRSITTRSVVRALTQFISVFGIPRVIQSDQGSNFSSRLFAQVLKQLKVAHNQASAYHPQSQGALERFHQTLKSMLRAYCVQMNRDWEEGLPWLLLSAREVIQESTGFSPNDLVFGHKVRGPLALVQDGWADSPPPQNLIDYINGFRYRLYKAQEVAKGKLGAAQAKMKNRFDRHAKCRMFLPGDQVLALLPLITSPFQAKLLGPYSVVEKVSDQNYIISTPDRRARTQLCHVNLLKPYYTAAKESDQLREGVHPACMAVSGSHVMGVVQEDEDVQEPDDMVLCGRLKNSECLVNLDKLLSHLDLVKREALSKLIKNFPGLFQDTPTCTHLVEHDIEVGECKPIRQRFYRVHPDKRKFLDAEVQYMLDNGIAQPSSSSWASPCLLVPKSDNTPRFCSDFRKVNSITKPDSFPLPRIEDCVDQVGSARFVSKFDLLKGYWQVPLSARAQEIAAFITPSGLYSYRVMPFGLRNAPATFQRLMNMVVKGLEGCSVYLDDVVIYSDDWETHLKRIEKLFAALANAKLTVNLSKCEFAKATVTYLGRVVGQGRVCPVRVKVEAVDKYAPPLTKKSPMRFLGLVGYYRSFCRNFSSVVAPLTNLLKSAVKYVWTPECQTAFESVKSLICNSPVLLAPRWDRGFRLEVDASHVGAGAVLMQPDDLGVDRPVCFFSRKFNKHQLNYSVIEKETLALVLALQHFHVYVSSGSVMVFTDHNPLTFLSSLQNPNRRLVRWALFLQSYSLDIRHIRGQDNVVADALSRAPQE